MKSAKPGGLSIWIPDPSKKDRYQCRDTIQLRRSFLMPVTYLSSLIKTIQTCQCSQTQKPNDINMCRYFDTEGVWGRGWGILSRVGFYVLFSLRFLLLVGLVWSSMGHHWTPGWGWEPNWEWYPVYYVGCYGRYYWMMDKAVSYQ